MSGLHLFCTAHKNTKKSPDNKASGSTSAAVIFEDISFFCSSSTVPCEQIFARPDLSSLVHSRECAKATVLFMSSFMLDLVAES